MHFSGVLCGFLAVLEPTFLDGWRLRINVHSETEVVSQGHSVSLSLIVRVSLVIIGKVGSRIFGRGARKFPEHPAIPVDPLRTGEKLVVLSPTQPQRSSETSREMRE
jgi:hypothetical protein